MFELKQQVLIGSYRGSRGKSDDAKHKANFTVEAENVPAANVAALFGVSPKDVPQLVDSFFQQMTAGSKGRRDKLYAAIGGMPSTYYAEGKHSIAFGERKPDRVDRLGAIKVTPRMDGKFDVEFSASIQEPMDSLCGYLNKHINKSVRCELLCDPGFEFQFKGSSQAPVDKTDGKQGDMLDAQEAAAAKARADAVGKAISDDDKKKAGDAAPKKPTKPAAKKPAAKKAAKPARKGRN